MPQPGILILPDGEENSAEAHKTVKKRGPAEERLIITEDPQAALNRLLKKKPNSQ